MVAVGADMLNKAAQTDNFAIQIDGKWYGVNRLPAAVPTTPAPIKKEKNEIKKEKARRESLRQDKPRKSIEKDRRPAAKPEPTPPLPRCQIRGCMGSPADTAARHLYRVHKRGAVPHTPHLGPDEAIRSVCRLCLWWHYGISHRVLPPGNNALVIDAVPLAAPNVIGPEPPEVVRTAPLYNTDSVCQRWTRVHHTAGCRHIGGLVTCVFCVKRMFPGKSIHDFDDGANPWPITPAPEEESESSEEEYYCQQDGCTDTGNDELYRTVNGKYTCEDCLERLYGKTFAELDGADAADMEKNHILPRKA